LQGRRRQPRRLRGRGQRAVSPRRRSARLDVVLARADRGARGPLRAARVGGKRYPRRRESRGQQAAPVEAVERAPQEVSLAAYLVHSYGITCRPSTLSQRFFTIAGSLRYTG